MFAGSVKCDSTMQLFSSFQAATGARQPKKKLGNIYSAVFYHLLSWFLSIGVCHVRLFAKADMKSLVTETYIFAFIVCQVLI